MMKWMRALVTAALRFHGAQVQSAGSATEALQTLQKNHFDALVSDIGMPESDGYAFIAQVRALSDAQKSRIPAVALTAYASPTDRARILEQGFQMHLAKLCDPEELAQVVANLTRHAGDALAPDGA